MCRLACELLKEFHDVHKKLPRKAVRSNDSRWTPSASGM